MAENKEKREKNDNPVQFKIENVYLLGLEFKADQPAYCYKNEWQPNASVEIESKHQKLKDGYVDVLLTLKVKVTHEEKHVFTAECQQGGVFFLEGFSDEQIEEVSKCHCLNILFPYARQKISDLITQSGYPVLHVNPVDFFSQYHSYKAQQSSQSTK